MSDIPVPLIESERPRKLRKREYRQRVALLRTQLLEAQEALRRAPFPVLIVVSGIDASGRSETVNTLNAWMDPRHLDTVAFDEAEPQEQGRPEFWRYWQALPRRGRIGIFYGGWYLDAIKRRLDRQLKWKDMKGWLRRAGQFEQLLIDDGALIVKLWLHIERDRLKKRLRRWESDPATAWRATARHWARYQQYDEMKRLGDLVLKTTHAPGAAWNVIDGASARRREVQAGEVILAALNGRLQGAADSNSTRPGSSPPPVPVLQAPPGGAEPAAPASIVSIAAAGSPDGQPAVGRLDGVDLSLALDQQEYERQRAKYQAKLYELGHEAWQQGLASVLVFQGPDAAGKGGAIRRLTEALDARQYRVIRIAAPTEEERGYHYLWRFWRHLPRAGRLTLFDRSWYGRVLVERVEGYASEAEWRRAYAEINDFEEQLCDAGVLLLKFWIHISPEEQLRRFEDRARVEYKQYKLTEDDFRNRAKLPQYLEAAEEMFAQTSTSRAPWHVVAGEHKLHARIEVLKTVCKQMSRRL